MPATLVFEKIRLFVASPSDIGSERERVKRVADRLNRSGGTADQEGKVLEVLGWETHVAPLMGRPEEVIISQLPVNEWDIFVGILWTKFGSPPGAKAFDSGEEYTSGTEEEFGLAYKSWTENKRPQILFYRCIHSPQRLDHVDPEQLHKIRNFFGRFEANGPNPGLYRTFMEWSDFENILEDDLSRVLKDLSKRRPPSPRVDKETGLGQKEPQNRDTEDPFRDFQEGTSYQLGFLSVDIADHSRMVSDINDPQASQALIKNFISFVQDAAHRHGGAIFSWAADGGILAFWNTGYHERALLAGIYLLHNIAIFNLDSTKNPLGAKFSLRMAANDATIIFHIPLSSISSDDLNFTVHLQEQICSPGEFCVTDTLLSNTSLRLRQLFSPKGRYKGKPVYSYHHAIEGNQITSAAMQALLADCKTKSRAFQSVLADDRELSKEELEGVSVLLDHFYSSLNKFCSWFSTIDERWAAKFLELAASVASSLLAEEACIFDLVRQRHRSVDDEELETLALIVSSRRSKPVISLDKLRTVLERRANGSPPKSSNGNRGQLNEKVANFASSDELEQETALMDLLMNCKDDLIDFLSEKHQNVRSLTEQLWKLSDLILQDDLYSLHHHRRQRDRKLVEVISEQPIFDPRFRGLRGLLCTIDVSPTNLADFFSAFNHKMEVGDYDIVWRCIIIGHPEERLRALAAGTLGIHSLWQLIARSRLPINALYQIGVRFQTEPEDFKKVFFDCTRGRLADEIQKVNRSESVPELARILEIFLGFDFLAETIYFERFDQLLSDFLGCLDRFKIKIAFVENIRTRLEQLDQERQERQRRGEPSGSTPKGIRELPLPIQRRLAGEAPYLLLFISHPNPKIALETFRHINLNNVERVLRFPEINQALLIEILSKAELFGRTNTVMTALMNPKCTIEFSRKYLPAIARSQQHDRLLLTLTQSSSVSTHVKAAAKSLLGKPVTRS